MLPGQGHLLAHVARGEGGRRAAHEQRAALADGGDDLGAVVDPARDAGPVEPDADAGALQGRDQGRHPGVVGAGVADEDVGRRRVVHGRLLL